MFQMIPIKRDEWSSEISDNDSESIGIKSGVSKYFYDGYKNYFGIKIYN